MSYWVTEKTGNTDGVKGENQTSTCTSLVIVTIQVPATLDIGTVDSR